MKDESKTKKQLVEELSELRQKVAELEELKSELEKVQNRAGKERERFFSLLDRLPLFAYLQAPDYSIHYANKFFLELYGEPKGRPCYEVIWGRKEPCDECPTFRVFDTNKPGIWESIHPSDGRTYKVYDFPFPDSDGSPMVLELSVDITDCKHAEEALKASETRYRMVHATAFDGIIIANADGKVVECNPSAEKIFGYGPGELVGKELTSIIPEEYHDRHLVGFRRFLKDRESGIQGKVLELKAVRSSGETFPIELIISSFTMHGEVFFTGTIRDITERKRSEEKRIDQFQLLQTLIDTIPSPIFYKDVEGRYLGCNKAFEESIGFSRDELVGKTVYDVAPRELADKYYEMDSALFEKPGVQIYESSVKYQDGSIHDVVFNKATFSQGGNVAGLVGVIVDITEHKRAELALQESEEKWKTISENSGDFIIITDPDGVLRYVNRTAPGLTKKQVIGRPVTDWLPSSYKPALKACFDRVVKTGKSDGFETEYIMSDGTVRYFEARVGPMSRDGKVVALTITATDVTERKRAEEEKAALQGQLMQAQKMEAIGTLAGGIAHDFNNVLTVVKSLSELVLNKIDGNDPLYGYLKPIRESSSRAINLVQQLLLFSSNKQADRAVLNINEVADNLMSMLEHLISEDIKLETDFKYDLWEVEADKGRIEQLITNLVINGSEAMSQGGRIVLRSENVTINDEQSRSVHGVIPGNFVCLTVEDTGIGMEKEVIEHIFEPFYTTKKTRGTGMGLAVVYGVVKELDGWIDVSSELGLGSTFKIFLPATVEGDEHVIEECPSRRLNTGGGKRILLVEDDKWVRKSTAMVLTENGYEVFEAASAENAISFFYREKGRFDLVLSDVVMPGRSGLQLVSPLLDINPDIPILLCSSHLDDKAQLDQIIKRGLAYIQKPYEIPDLLQAIEETISQN